MNTTHDMDTLALNPEQTLLTPKQGKILADLANGYSLDEISASQGHSKLHLEVIELPQIRAALGARTNHHLVARGILGGILKSNWVACVSLAFSFMMAFQELEDATRRVSQSKPSSFLHLKRSKEEIDIHEPSIRLA